MNTSDKAKILTHPNKTLNRKSEDISNKDTTINKVVENLNAYTPFINPEIVKKRFFLPAVSRCYSVKGTYFPKRYYWIKLKYQNIEGEAKEEVFMGLSAFVVQHEIDHLYGKLINDSK